MARVGKGPIEKNSLRAFANFKILRATCDLLSHLISSQSLRWLWNKFHLLLFEVVELHFDQCVIFQRVIQGGEELQVKTFFARFQPGLEPLGLGYESTYLRIGKRIHCAKIRKICPTSHKEFRSERKSRCGLAFIF